MSAPHVTGVIALMIGARILGADPSPERVQARLEATARDLGTPGRDQYYGSGLLDATAALTAPVTARPDDQHAARRVVADPLGTEPSRNRRAPVIPLLPTTMRSAPCSSATSRIASAGSPWRA